MTIRLRLRQQPPIPIDVGFLSLASLAGLSTHAVAKLPLAIGRQRFEVGAWFEVAGRGGDRIAFEGDCEKLFGIGSELAGGEVIVEGSAGAQLGRRMTAGTIRVGGNVGRQAASGMRGGRIDIDGDAGDWLGGPRRGERTGMRGGRVIVRGDAGQGTGHRMRRGTIIVHGSVGPCCGLEMVAGTIAAIHVDGAGLGFGMRRGSILVYGHATSFSFPSATSCFAPPTPAPAGFLKLWLDDLLPDLDTERADHVERHPDRWRRSIGDLSTSGLGEVIW